MDRAPRGPGRHDQLLAQQTAHVIATAPTETRFVLHLVSRRPRSPPDRRAAGP
ncbi:hypothetical protein HBB16_13995 [Pseudonocardia sp. MCCB 268]|nr:hypothetical protein [Pseudonocardia cytotoxica]